MNLEELIKKVDENTKRLDSHLEEIKKNGNNISHNDKRIQQNSYTLEILKDYKTESKRLFIILIIVLSMWFLTIGYLVYVLNDTGTIEEETTTQEISDVETINGGVVNKGDINYGESETNSQKN